MATDKTEQLTDTKNDRVYVRLNRQLKREFEILAKFKGLTTSAMLHSYVVRSVYEGKQANSLIFIEESNRNPPRELPEKVSLSEKLVSAKNLKKDKKKNTFTTSDGKTIPLVDEGVDEE